MEYKAWHTIPAMQGTATLESMKEARKLEHSNSICGKFNSLGRAGSAASLLTMVLSAQNHSE
eukprot:1063236-Amphidinium_carterae.1